MKDTTSWSEYFIESSRRAGYTTDRRGWASELASTIGMNASAVSRWRDGQIPGVDACRALANAWNVPLLDVLVAAGILTKDEAQWNDRPTRLANVQAVLDDPNTAPVMRNLLATVLDDISRAASQL